MLDHEYAQLLERLGAKRGNATFFVFADTVVTRRSEHGRGRLGIRFQASLRQEPSEIIADVHWLDSTGVRQRPMSPPIKGMGNVTCCDDKELPVGRK